jgi:N-acetylmuramoyl-L-alanine amidase
MALVVIDPGHGGKKKIGHSSPNNAEGPTGLLEKTVTLQLAKRAKGVLTSTEVSVILTRDTDKNLGLKERAYFAKQRGAEAFVSVHLNGDKKSTVQGTETWVHPRGSSASLLLAHSVQDAVVAVTGYKYRGVKRMSLGVLRPDYHLPKTAACLVEVSFMTDPADEVRLRDAGYRGKLGAAIAKGIESYLRAVGELPKSVTKIVGGENRVVEDAIVAN